MAQVDAVVAKLQLDIADFTRGLKTAQDQMNTSTKAMGGAVSGLENALGGLQGSFRAISTGLKGLFAGAVVTGAIGLVKSIADVGDELNKLSIQTGASVEDLSALRLAAQLNDTTIGDVARSMNFLNRSMAEARAAPGPARDAFHAINIELKDLDALSGKTVEAYERVAKGIDALGNSSDQTVVKMQLLSRAGNEQSAMLQDVAQRGMKGLREESDRLNQTWSTESARAADEFNDAMDRVKSAATGLASHLVRNVMPSITTFLNDVRRILGGADAAEKAGARLNAIITEKADVERKLKLQEAQLGKLPESMRAEAQEKINALKEHQLKLDQESFTLNTSLLKLTEGPPKTPGDEKSKLAPSIEKTNRALNDQLQAIEKNEKTLARYTGQGTKGYDALTAKANAYQQFIEETNKLQGEQAVATDDPRLKTAIATHADLVRQIEAREAAEKKGTKATSEAEAKAKQTAEALKKLGEEETKVALQSAIMGPSFDAAGAQLGQLQRQIEFAIEHGTIPAGEAVTQLAEQVRQLTSQQELTNLGKQLTAIALSESLFHDTLAAGEARLQAYSSTIGTLGTRIGESARPQMEALTEAMNEQARVLRPIIEGAKIGEAYKSFAMGLQQLNQEQAVFSDEGVRATKTLELYTTLFQALVGLGQGAAESTRQVVDNLNQLKQPDLGRLQAQSARGAELFGGLPLAQFDPLTDRLQRLRAELERIRNDPSIDIHSRQVENLVAEYKTLGDVIRFGEIGGEVFHGLSEGLDQLITGVLQGTQTIDQAFNKLAQSLILGFTRRVLQEMFKPLEDALIKLMRQLAMSGLEGLTGALGLGFAGGKTVMADTPGLITTQPAQHGGLFSKPTMALLAEAGSPEVVMPQHKMEAWMQNMMAGIEPGGTAVVVNITNNAPKTQVSQKQGTGPQGERSVDVVIDEAVANTLSRQGTQSRRVLRSQYGATPTLIGR